MEIRKATHTDVSTLKEFQKMMARETENLELNDEILEKGILAIINESAKGYYFVAEVENRIAGCLMVTPEWSDWRNGIVWWIQSVYVIKDFRRKGVYRMLYEHIKSWVNENDNYCGIRLYVEKENFIAQEVYKNLNMDGEHYKLFEWMKSKQIS